MEGQNGSGAPRWSRGDRSKRGTPRLTIIRTPEVGTLVAHVLSRDWCEIPTHYWVGRTQPCVEGFCPACAAGSQVRVKLYCHIMGVKTRQQAMFEGTDFTVENWDDYKRLNGTMRGAVLTAARGKKKKNGRVIVTFQQPIEREANLAPEIDIESWLYRLWGIDREQIDLPGVHHAEGIADKKRFSLERGSNGRGQIQYPSDNRGV